MVGHEVADELDKLWMNVELKHRLWPKIFWVRLEAFRRQPWKLDDLKKQEGEKEGSMLRLNYYCLDRLKAVYNDCDLKKEHGLATCCNLFYNSRLIDGRMVQNVSVNHPHMWNCVFHPHLDNEIWSSFILGTKEVSLPLTGYDCLVVMTFWAFLSQLKPLWLCWKGF